MFDDRSEKKISPLIASPANRGSDDTIDSEGIATYSNYRTEPDGTVITGIGLPKTGGIGTVPYTTGGFMLLTGAGFILLQKYTKRRRQNLQDA